MNLTRDQIETAMDSAKEARDIIDQLLQVVGEEYSQVEVLSETIDELMDKLEEDLTSCLEEE
jgi:hypothetical protein